MSTPVHLRPRSWELRRRLIAAAVALLVVVGATLWWLGGAEDRRAGSACDYFDEQQSALRTVTIEADGAAGRAETAGDDTVIGYLDNVDREFNSLRRWQSTYPRLTDDLGDVGDEGIDQDAATVFELLDQGTAEMQRLLEGASPTKVRAWTPEFGARLDVAEKFCDRL